MSVKKHVLFIISNEPLNLGEEIINKIAKSNHTEHFLYEEVELVANRGPEKGDMKIKKAIPLHSKSESDGFIGTGIGDTVSATIASFLKDIVSAVFYYKPHYRKENGELEKTIEAIIKTDSGK